MTIDEFARSVPGLATMSHVDTITHLAWFLHTHGGKDRFQAGDIRACYDQLHYSQPANVPSQLQQMWEAKQRKLLKDARGYRLEGRVKEALDKKYAQRPETVAVTEMLSSLPGRITNEAERLFLTEALTCFRAKAFRATVVMTWNLAYDHLVNWVIGQHLAAFNAAIPVRFPKKPPMTMAKRDDFEELKESEVIEVCGTANLIGGNTKKILTEKLTRRNMAAHPSHVEIGQAQAEDVITDLVNNVILKLV